MVKRKTKRNNKMNKCPKCGTKYDKALAISRIDESYICPDCGIKEALEVAVHARVFSKEQVKDIMDEILNLKK